MPHTVYIALGSNIGHRLDSLRKAFQYLQTEALTQATTSIVLETPALLPPNAPPDWDQPYLNAIVSGTTNLEPETLLSVLQNIEQRLGRSQEHPHWGPRTIDLDILLYDAICLKTERLTIPHPEIKNRAFWLHLLGLLAPDLTHPETHETFNQLAQQAFHETPPVFTRSYALYPQCVGIVNVTPNSFSDGTTQAEAAIAHAKQLIQEGASILDIGAESTNPRSNPISPAEEWVRLQPVLEELKEQPIPISIDTYHPETVENALTHYPIAWINDVSGRLPEKTLRLIAQKGCKICTMHALSVPVKPNEWIPSVADVNRWCEQQVEHLIRCGFSKTQIILDPGIGFGKTRYQSGWLLKTIRQWKQWGCEILIGHSRKSFYKAISRHSPQEYDLETVALSLVLKQHVDYLRIHNVEAHQRAFVAQQWIE